MQQRQTQNPGSKKDAIVAVIGAGECDAAVAEDAAEVGRLLAAAGATVVTGGLGGVMEAASRGAREAGGQVVGILPGDTTREANAWVDFPIATGAGDARNAFIANTADGFIAVSGSFGTLSEMAFALKRRKPVVSLGGPPIDGDVQAANSPAEAVASLFAALGR